MLYWPKCVVTTNVQIQIIDDEYKRKLKIFIQLEYDVVKNGTPGPGAMA